MKTKLLSFLFILLSGITFSQVTTEPTIPTPNSEITITLDATGTGLENYTGTVYAHTGVTANGEQWQYVIGEWGENAQQPELTRDSSNPNIYTLEISPNVYEFYNAPTTDEITQLSFVFRSSDGSQQTSPDFFIDLYNEGLNITFTSPENNSVFDKFESFIINVDASINADLELFINETSIKTATNSTSISKTHSFSTSGTYTIKATASNGSETVEDEISVFVKSSTQNAAQPSGLNYGINKNPDNSVTFLLKAPNKNDVFIIGDFNDWTFHEDYQMYKDGNDFWLTISNFDINTEYAYQYYIDFDIKVADPYSEKILDPWTDQYIKDGNYPNLKEYPNGKTTGYVSTFLINEDTYSWEVSDFTRPNKDNLIIYELHIRDFVESDSYTEAITKLDYLESLGINAIELMPVNEFEGADSWGYNPALFFALDKAYGTKNNFKKFVDECHKRGIAVLADVVFNHSYGQSPLAQMYWNSTQSRPSADNPWYNEEHNFVDNTDAHWGYDFNHESEHTVEFFNDVLDYWMSEYKIDGFRFDFTKGFSNTEHTFPDIWGGNYDASRITILKNYADHVWDFAPSNKPYVIFEHLADNSEETELANYGIMLWGNMNHNYSQNTMGWPSDTDINWISYKQRNWNQPSLLGYMESHDEERLMYRNLQSGNGSSNYDIKDLNTALSRQELAGMFFFTIPGPKMIWQFGELGYDVSINDPGRVDRKPIRWEYYDNANRKQLYNTWATLIEFKKQEPAFNSENFTLNVSGLTKTIVLEHETMDVVLIGNFNIQTQEISTTFTKTGTWFEYFTGEERAVSATTETITLAPGEYRLYSTKKLLDPRGGTSSDDNDNDGVTDDVDLCPNTLEGTEVNETGCPIFSLAADNFTIETIGETCPDENNGIISIEAKENFNYSTTISGVKYEFTSSLNVENLTPGSYDFCISIDEKNYEQCFTLEIIEGTTISGKTTVKNQKATVELASGTAPFKVFINGKIQFETQASTFDVNVNNGDYLEVKSSIDCEGVFAKQIDGIEELTVYPNPTTNSFEISVPNYETNNEGVLNIYNLNGQLAFSKYVTIKNNKVNVEIAHLPKNIYLVSLELSKSYSFKIIKN